MTRELSRRRYERISEFYKEERGLFGLNAALNQRNRKTKEINEASILKNVMSQRGVERDFGEN